MRSKAPEDEPPPKNANTADTVVGIAKLIGIDMVNEPQFLWIAEEASRAPMPHDWKELTNQDVETLYYHTRERRLQKEHPLVWRYKEVYHKARAYQKQLVNGEVGNPLEKPDVLLSA